MEELIEEQFKIKRNRLIKYHEQEGITDVVIPEGVTEIRRYAFEDCTNLTSITIPEGVTTIEGYAFIGCTNLTSINIPHGVTIIRSFTFAKCTSLTNVKIPEGVTGIGWRAFAWCKNLTEITIPKSVTIIGEGAFKDCISLTEITIPENVTTIDKYAFSGCTNLTSVTFGKGLKEMIAAFVFENCDKLKIVNVPSYEVFELLDFGLQAIAFNTIIKNNQQFSEEENNNFKEYLIENKMYFFYYILFRNLFDLLNYILDNKMLTKEETDKLLNEAIKMDLNKTNTESFRTLMKYKFDNFNVDMETQILNMLDGLNLDGNELSDETYEDKNDEEKGITK